MSSKVIRSALLKDKYNNEITGQALVQQGIQNLIVKSGDDWEKLKKIGITLKSKKSYEINSHREYLKKHYNSDRIQGVQDLASYLFSFDWIQFDSGDYARISDYKGNEEYYHFRTKEKVAGPIYKTEGVKLVEPIATFGDKDIYLSDIPSELGNWFKKIGNYLKIKESALNNKFNDPIKQKYKGKK